MHSLRSCNAQAEDPSAAPNRMLPGQARGLTYTVDGERLIDNLDLNLEANTKTVIMGANGAGKSVLLRLLHGLLSPTSGEIYWGGRLIDQSVRIQQAMVFQRPVLLRRSVLANVQFVLDLRGRGEPGEAPEILAQVGLGKLAKRPARQLSGGEQQRLALARALALEPMVLFLDEPTANLDPAATASIETIINRFHANSTKVILVTHDVGQARRVADDVVFLHHGRLIEHTEATSFFARSSSKVARNYLAGELVF